MVWERPRPQINPLILLGYSKGLLREVAGSPLRTLAKFLLLLVRKGVLGLPLALSCCKGIEKCSTTKGQHFPLLCDTFPKG